MPRIRESANPPSQDFGYILQLRVLLKSGAAPTRTGKLHFSGRQLTHLATPDLTHAGRLEGVDVQKCVFHTGTRTFACAQWHARMHACAHPSELKFRISRVADVKLAFE